MTALLEVEALHKDFGGGNSLFGARRALVRAVCARIVGGPRIM